MRTSFLLVPVFWALCHPPATLAAAQLVSATNPRLPVAATAGGISGSASMTPDNRFVVYISDAPNLTTNRHYQVLDVFLRDRVLGTTRLMSASTDGSSGGEGDSQAPVVSTNGQWVAFQSDASNLTPGDTNQVTDVFLRDVGSGVTRLISVTPDGSQGNGPSTYPILSADGRRIAFESLADNLTTNDTNHVSDVFVRDIASQTTILVSANAAGDAPGNGPSKLEGMTPDGRYVLYSNTGTFLTPGVTKLGQDVLVRDLTTGLTIWASTNANRLLGFDSPRDCKNPTIDAAGRQVAFEIINGWGSLIVCHDLLNGLTRLVCSNGLAVVDVKGHGWLWNYSFEWSKPRLSANGRFLAFVRPVSMVSNYINNVYIWDAETGAITLASANGVTGGFANASSDRPKLSEDGRTVAFVSLATDLSAELANGLPQIYVRDLASGLTLAGTSNRFGVLSDVGDFVALDLSPDGSCLLFETIDRQMVENDLNATQDIFLRDLRSGRLELISVADPSLPCRSAGGISVSCRSGISADGHSVAFTSLADNRSAGEGIGAANIYWRDLDAGSNLLVSVNREGVNSIDGGSMAPAINANGRFIAFASNAGDLVSNDANRQYDVFIRDMESASCELVSATAGLTSPTNGWSGAPWISPDGRAVVFASQAPELVDLGVDPLSFRWCLRDVFNRDTALIGVDASNHPLASPGFVGLSSPRQLAVFETTDHGILAEDSAAGTVISLDSSAQDAQLSANRRWLVYGRPRQQVPTEMVVWDLANDTNLVVSVTGGVRHPSVSDDGGKIAFEALGDSPANAVRQIFLYDATRNTRLLVTTSVDGAASGNGDSSVSQVSSDGRYVVFQSAADNLVPNDRNGRMDVFARDVFSGITHCLSLNLDGTGPGNGYSINPVLSGDGRTVVFTSDATDLIPGDFNHLPDVFAVRLPAASDLRILTVDLSVPGNTTLRWTANVGGIYRVQYKNNLWDSLWTDIPDDVTAISATGEKSDNSAPATLQRFYRIQLVR